MKDFMRRVGWASLAILFVITGVGVGIYAFWQGTHQSNSNQTQNQTKSLDGTKLANFTPIAHVAKLQAINTKAGTGTTVQPGDTVTVLYKGALASTGIIFDDGGGQQAQISLSQVIAGWVVGLPGMKVGGTRRLLIPAAYAYGASPPAGSTIPANADLVFDITLLGTQPASQK